MGRESPNYVGTRLALCGVLQAASRRKLSRSVSVRRLTHGGTRRPGCKLIIVLECTPETGSTGAGCVVVAWDHESQGCHHAFCDIEIVRVDEDCGNHGLDCGRCCGGIDCLEALSWVLDHETINACGMTDVGKVGVMDESLHGVVHVPLSNDN